ncbi:MAG: tyrosine-protein phosphatase [Dysgonamonadaceae bacterium]|jgi:protein-tyrosine phosphatase|nr:tyrosine-protein phosphatase [Dysgonamonadaceae bacterium]
MFKNVVFSFISVVLFAGCAQDSPQINAVCDLMPNGLFLIKWETFPSIEGVVKGYESNRPDSFNTGLPDFEQKIETGYQRVLARANNRSYFKLVFNNPKHSIVVAERKLPTQGILNFRDLGGYDTQDKRQVKWGKIYHSSSLSMATRYDRSLLKNLYIETVIDFRSEKEREYAPAAFQAAQMYNWPLRGNPHNFFFDEILSRRVKVENILLYDQNNFSFLWENNTDYFIKMFDVLLDEKNYPVTISCFFGKDRSAIASALILAALDVEQEVIVEDFLLYNQNINLNSIVKNADAFNFEIQEAITALYSVHKETIENAFDLIKENYGSVDNYLEKELHLNNKKREKLRSILLY